MSKGRKTIEVSDILDLHDLYESYKQDDKSLDQLRLFVSDILIRTGNYEGFKDVDNKTIRYFRNDRTHD